VSRPKYSIFSAEPDYVKEFHALHRVKTMNYPPLFRNGKTVTEKEMFLILDSKNTATIFAL
jgi:hypothetical protein